MTEFGEFSARSPGDPGTYATYIENDPFRRGLHYPAVMAELGDLTDKRVVDLGTGDGQLPRLLAAQAGASVVGFDHNPQMIGEATAHPDTARLAVKFIVATPQSFTDDGSFDAATSVMVLNYATGPDDLAGFFRCAHPLLRDGGKFVSIVLRPAFRAYDVDFIIRRFFKLDGNQVRMEFCEGGSRRMGGVTHQYAAEAFEHAARAGGLASTEWRDLFAAPQALQQMGEGFWQPCHIHQPYTMLIARKR